MADDDRAETAPGQDADGTARRDTALPPKFCMVAGRLDVVALYLARHLPGSELVVVSSGEAAQQPKRETMDENARLRGDQQALERWPASEDVDALRRGMAGQLPSSGQWVVGTLEDLTHIAAGYGMRALEAILEQAQRIAAAELRLRSETTGNDEDRPEPCHLRLVRGGRD